MSVVGTDRSERSSNNDAELMGYVCRALGYSLTGDCREEIFFVTWGEGCNGKSTI